LPSAKPFSKGLTIKIVDIKNDLGYNVALYWQLKLFNVMLSLIFAHINQYSVMMNSVRAIVAVFY
tara:strand:- start:12221 stop:12415 length:195 start_codon:yes stop_codon:yes gene_type:complete